MARTTRDIWNDDDGEEEERPKHRGLRNFFIFFFALAAVLLVVLAAAWRDGTGLDALRRYFAYGKSENAGGYVYEASSSNRFANLNDTLVVLSTTALSLIDGEGNTVWSASVKMTSPALSSGGGYAVAYDVGGTELYVMDGQGLRYQLTANASEPYIAASLNSRGALAVTAQKQGHKGAVAVYDTAGELEFEFRSSERFVSNAYVTNDGTYLAAVTLGQDNGMFASTVVLYDLAAPVPADNYSVEPTGNYSVSGGLCLDIGQIGKKLVTVCDDQLDFGSVQEGTTAAYSYGGEYLREYGLGGEDYAVLLLNRYQSGSVGRLVTVDTNGQEIASLPVTDEIWSISATGRYLAVLYADRLVIYNSMLEEYASLNGTGYAREVLVGADGSALLLASERAERFLP